MDVQGDEEFFDVELLESNDNVPMSDVILRPILEADLDDLCRYAIDPEAGGEFEWAGFKDPKALRRRWDEDSWLGAETGRLAVESSGSFVGEFFSDLP